MYCKYCGAKIDDDSIYCLSCGSKVENNSELEKVNKKVSVSDEVNKEEVKGHGLKIFLGFFIVLLVIICIFPYFSNNQNNGGDNNIVDNLLERDITKNDYTIVTSQDLTTYTIMVTPKIDIKYCEVHCSFYDGDDPAYVHALRYGRRTCKRGCGKLRNKRVSRDF